MSGLKIYVCCHFPCSLPPGPLLEPIQVGRAVSPVRLAMRGDDTGFNISALNRHYCELTALYWIWQNTNHEYFGLFHYRRFMNFCTEATRFANMQEVAKYGLSKEAILPLLKEYDIILPQRKLPSPQRESLYALYAKSHVATDMDYVLDLIGRKYPQMKETAEEVLFRCTRGYYKNMMVAPRYFWEGYCRWLFDLLGSLHAVIVADLPKRDDYQQRVYGFMAERLLNVYVEHVFRSRGLKIKEVPLLEYHPAFAEDFAPAENF